MPAIGLDGSSSAAGVDRVVRTDDQHDIGVVEVGVDLVHLEHDVVRHLRLGEQHVPQRQVPVVITGQRPPGAVLTGPDDQLGDVVGQRHDPDMPALAMHGQAVAGQVLDQVVVVDLGGLGSP